MMRLWQWPARRWGRGRWSPESGTAPAPVPSVPVALDAPGQPDVGVPESRGQSIIDHRSIAESVELVRAAGIEPASSFPSDGF
jgi:hypothetical protein